MSPAGLGASPPHGAPKSSRLGGLWTSTRAWASITKALCGVSMTTVVASSPNGPRRSNASVGSGLTVRLVFITVWVADELGVRRNTQRAKLTSDS